jgi:hypothetical protein
MRTAGEVVERSNAGEGAVCLHPGAAAAARSNGSAAMAAARCAFAPVVAQARRSGGCLRQAEQRWAHARREGAAELARAAQEAEAMRSGERWIRAVEAAAALLRAASPFRANLEAARSRVPLRRSAVAAARSDARALRALVNLLPAWTAAAEGPDATTLPRKARAAASERWVRRPTALKPPTFLRR